PLLGSGSLPTLPAALQGHLGSEPPRSFSARLRKRTGSPRRIRPVADCHLVLPRRSRSHLRLSSGSGNFSNNFLYFCPQGMREISSLSLSHIHRNTGIHYNVKVKTYRSRASTVPALCLAF